MNIKRKYCLTVMLTIVVLIFNQIVIQYYLHYKKEDAKTINIAGKQRMLSQRLSIEIYRWTNLSLEEKPQQKKVAESLFLEWKENHFALLNGNKENHFRPVASEEAKLKLNSITQHIDFIENILSLEMIDAALLKSIYFNQIAFLKEMDKTVSIIEQKANRKLDFIICIEIVFLLLSIAMIFLELVYIYSPTVKQLKTQNLDLHSQNEKLKKYYQSNAHLSKFSHIISHDLKAPMRVIVSFSQILQRTLSKENMEPKCREYLDFIIKSVKEMSLLVDDLFQFASLEGSKVNLEEFNLKEQLEHIQVQLQKKIKEKNATTTFKGIPSGFVADKTKSKLIFQNLISNAIKYSHKDIPPQITIECVEKEHNWEFKVQDNGIGIDHKYHQDIFEVFVKLDVEKKASSGVGLALVKTAVEKHQGNIKVESLPGEGSTFIFSMAKFCLQ